MTSRPFISMMQTYRSTDAACFKASEYHLRRGNSASRRRAFVWNGGRRYDRHFFSVTPPVRPVVRKKQGNDIRVKTTAIDYAKSGLTTARSHAILAPLLIVGYSNVPLVGSNGGGCIVGTVASTGGCQNFLKFFSKRSPKFCPRGFTATTFINMNGAADTGYHTRRTVLLY